jgi:hypothetical protein
VTATGTVTLTPAQLSMLLEGIDWRRPERTFTPMLAGWKRQFCGTFSRSPTYNLLWRQPVGSVGFPC